MEYIDLLIDNGELVRIECPDEHFDKIMEHIENTLKKKDWWSPEMVEGCTAEYLGHLLGRVNMARVVGML